MQRPDKIWWCRQVNEETGIEDLLAIPRYGNCRTVINNLCRTDYKPCDIIEGAITWEKGATQ